MSFLTYEERMKGCKQPLLKKLFSIIIEKKSNLCVAANFKSIEETLDFVDQVGSHICILKTQSERLKGDIEENLKLLYEKKKKYNFLLFEDRKFYDGKETIESIYSEKYVKYADLVTVVPSCGDGIFEAIAEAVRKAKLPPDEPRGCLAVCELSFAGVIPVDSEILMDVSNRHQDICVGIIAQKLQIKDKYAMIKATPGVHIDLSADGGNQQWRHPSVVIGDGADIVIVGRGIVSATKNELAAITCKYKNTSFEAYLALLR